MSILLTKTKYHTIALFDAENVYQYFSFSEVHVLQCTEILKCVSCIFKYG